jgi:hypothetical protein
VITRIPVLMLLIWPTVVGAQDLDDILAGFYDSENIVTPDDGAGDTGLDDILAGFEEDGALSNPEGDAPPETVLPFKGIFGQRIVANVGGADAPHDAITSLRSQINLSTDIDLASGWRLHAAGHTAYDGAFALNGRQYYTSEFLDAQEAEADIGELFIQGQIGDDLDLKIGRQIVVWGKSDAIRVTDILNPIDMREPGLTDIRDLRLPVTMAKLDYYFGAWNLSAIAIPEIRFNKLPPLGSDFFPGAAPPPEDDYPAIGFGNTEYAAALNGTFKGWDMSLYAASVFNDAPHGVSTAGGPRRRHARLGMIGASANVGVGNWLLKGEVAAFDGLKFMGAPGETFRRVDTMIGFDFNGFSWGTLTLEAANRHILEFDPAISGGPEDARENELELAFRVGTSLMNDKLRLSGVASVLGAHGENGGFRRVDAVYEINDQSELKLGVVDYVSGDKTFFTSIGDKDRIFLKYERQF